MTDGAAHATGGVLVVGTRPGPGWELALALSEHRQVVFVSFGDEAPSAHATPRLRVAGSWDGRSPDDLAALDDLLRLVHDHPRATVSAMARLSESGSSANN